MKIGIITFNNTINYGALFQAYALQKCITEIGYESEIIQYNNKYIEKKEKSNNKFKIKSVIKKIMIGKKLRNKEKKFKKFEQCNIKYGLLYDEKNVIEINKEYDVFITGSDQVWNLKLTNSDYHYFLDFVDDNKIKISYAPSFGNIEIEKEKYERVKMLLNRYQSISVREKSGSEFINKLGIKSTVVLDPTLLLTSEDWDKLINYKKKYEHYILVYIPHNKKKVFEFAKKISKEKNIPIVYLSISPKRIKGVYSIYDSSPETFLGLIKDADYVITGSFHGVAFSLNFGKTFFYEDTGENSRIGNLVKLTRTENRMIDINNINYNNMEYKEINRILSNERKKSIDFLKNNLENIER